MKFKKFLSALIAGALAVTSLAVPTAYEPSAHSVEGDFIIATDSIPNYV